MPLILLAFFVGLFGIVAFPSFVASDLTAGSPSPETIKAPRSIEYVDDTKTEELRQERAGRIEPTTIRDSQVELDAVASMTDFFSSVRAAKEVDLTQGERFTDRTNAAAAIGAEEGQIAGLLDSVLAMNDSALSQLERDVRREVESRYTAGLSEVTSPPSSESGTVVSSPIDALSSWLVVTPNQTLDEEATARARAIAADEVEPYLVSKQAGEIVVRDGEIVTPEQMDVLRRLGLAGSGIEPQQIMGTFIYIGAVLLLLSLYLKRQQRDVYTNSKHTFLLGLILLSIVLIAKVTTPALSPYLVPVPAVGLLVTMLFSPGLGLVTVLTAAFLVAPITGSLEGTLVGVMGGLFAVYLVSDMRSRTKLAAAGAWLGVGVGFVAFATTLIGGDSVLSALREGGWGVLGGLGSAAIGVGLLFLIEAAFGITSDLRLIELANPNQPLLKELMLKAPGTYSHSIMAANLAEAAAEAVGANPLLARAGAYYHDVGKMRRPMYFIENNPDQSNGHDKIKPHASRSIITSHVSEGSEMAKEHKLPKEVVDILEEHHGNSLIAYFYDRAMKEADGRKVNADEFRYSGRLPRSKEAALVMLADSCEAAGRSLEEPTQEGFRKMVRKIIDGKVKDGQLNESDLTLGNLNSVASSFAQVLAGVYHSRIEYPELPEEDDDEDNGSGTTIPFPTNRGGGS